MSAGCPAAGHHPLDGAADSALVDSPTASRIAAVPGVATSCCMENSAQQSPRSTTTHATRQAKQLQGSILLLHGQGNTFPRRTRHQTQRVAVPADHMQAVPRSAARPYPHTTPYRPATNNQRATQQPQQMRRCIPRHSRCKETLPAEMTCSANGAGWTAPAPRLQATSTASRPTQPRVLLHVAAGCPLLELLPLADAANTRPAGHHAVHAGSHPAFAAALVAS